MNRTTEFVTGLIGGIFGVGLAVLMMLGGLIGSTYVEMESGSGAVSSTETTYVLWAGVLLLLLSGASIVFSIPSLIRKNNVLSGVINLITGIMGFFIALFLWLIPGVLLVISGALCLRSPKPSTAGNTDSSAAPPSQPEPPPDSPSN